jgi:hypothetical protein
VSPGTDDTLTSGTPSAELHEQTPKLSIDQEIRLTIDALREQELLQALDLPEKRAQRLLSTLHDARRIRQAYQVRRADIEHQLEALLDYPQPDHTKIQQALQELEIAKTGYYQQILQTDQTLWALLSPEEQAQYILFQRNFTQQLQDIIIKIRQERIQSEDQFNFLLRRQNNESVIRRPR